MPVTSLEITDIDWLREIELEGGPPPCLISPALISDLETEGAEPGYRLHWLENSNALLRATFNRVCHRSAEVMAENLALRRELTRMRGSLVPRTGAEDPSPSNPAPEATTPVGRRVADVIADITGGHVSRPDLKRLGDAVGTATAPETGRKAQDQALGRAIGRNP